MTPDLRRGCGAGVIFGAVSSLTDELLIRFAVRYLNGPVGIGNLLKYGGSSDVWNINWILIEYLG